MTATITDGETTPTLNLQKANKAILKEAFPQVSYGIFDFISAVPFADLFNNVTLNSALYLTFGERKASPALAYFMFNAQQGFDGCHSVTDADAYTLATIIRAKYIEKWERYYTIYNSEYNPIENYNMTERGTDSQSGVERGTEQHDKTLSNNRVSSNENSVTTARNSAQNVNKSADFNANIANTGNNSTTESNTAQDNIYAFNSVSSVPRNESEGENKTNQSSSATEKQTNATNENEKNTLSESGVSKSGLKETESNNAVERDGRETDLSRTNNTLHNLTRSGNIGVTTTQQMLKQEMDFWKWNYFDSIIRDVAEFLTIPTY